MDDLEPVFYTLQQKISKVDEWITVDEFLSYDDAIEACRGKVADKTTNILLSGIFRLTRDTLMWNKEVP